MKKLHFALIGASILMACSQPQKSGDEINDPSADTLITEKVDSNETNIFGETISPEGAMTVADMQAALVGKDSVEMKVKAVVTDVCAKKGCWMKLAVNDSTDMRITFKDYGFFVPKDISGKEVIMEGVAKREVTSVADLKHFAEDGGKTPEEIAKITEPEEAITFEAVGVIIL